MSDSWIPSPRKDSDFLHRAINSPPLLSRGCGNQPRGYSPMMIEWLGGVHFRRTKI